MSINEGHLLLSEFWRKSYSNRGSNVKCYFDEVSYNLLSMQSGDPLMGSCPDLKKLHGQSFNTYSNTAAGSMTHE